MLLEDHATRRTLWTSQAVQNAHLHEWMPEHGFRPGESEHDDRMNTVRHTIVWEVPDQRVIKVPGGTLTLGPHKETEEVYGPDRSIRTGVTAVLRPDEPATLDDLTRRLSFPLVAFTTFVADREDRFTFEVVSHKEDRRRAVMLRTGSSVEPRGWRPNAGRYLFRADEVDDESETLSRWYRRYAQTGPSIGTFVDTYEQGATYSRARLIALVTAAEAYRRSCLRKKRVPFYEILREVRAHGRLDPTVSGCTDERRRLIADARNYFAHLGDTKSRYSAEEIEDATIDNCRCVMHLLQACLMQELAIPVGEATVLFEAHYRNSRLPTPLERSRAELT